MRSVVLRFSRMIITAGAVVLAACGSDASNAGGEGRPRPGADRAVAEQPTGIRAVEAGEVVIVRWARNIRFRETYPTAAAARGARFEVQHSTTGKWDGEETVLTRQMSQRPAQSMWKYYSEGLQTSVPPLEEQEEYGSEEFIHHAPVQGLNYYRFREVIWKAGSMVSQGPWSETAGVNYSGRDVPKLPKSLPEYSPGGLPSLIVSQMVGNSAGADTSVAYAAVATRQRVGPRSWRSTFAKIQNTAGLLSRTGAIGWCIKDLAVRKLYLDDGVSVGTSGRVSVGSLPRPTGAYPSVDPPPYASLGAFADDATMSLPEVWWRGVQHIRRDSALSAPSEVEGKRLQAFVEDYGEWDNGLYGPKFVYCGCPFTENGSFETEALLAKSHMRPIVAASHIVIMGTTATAQIVDEATGTPTAAARFIGWWHEAFPGQWIFVEPGLRRQRTRHWMDTNDYPYVGSWQTIDNLFNQPELARSRRLVLRTGDAGSIDDPLDPRDYPQREHIVYVAANVCPYVAEGRTNAEKVDRIIEVCRLLYEFYPAFIVQIGDAVMLEDLRADQAEALVRLAEVNAGHGGS